MRPTNEDSFAHKLRKRSGTAACQARARASSLVLVAGLGVAGCAVGPNYRKPDPSAPATWSRLEATGTPVANAGVRGDLSQWWRSFNDPLLSELVDEAQRQSLDLRKARARLREARARRAVAGAAHP